MTAPLALTMGDPAGIGAEIAIAARVRRPEGPPFFLIDDPERLAAMAAGLRIMEISAPAETLAAWDRGLPVLAQPLAARPEPGRPDPANAPAVVAAVERAVALVEAGEAAAVVTNPVSKKVLQDGAGFAHPGHTEFLAALSGAARPVMMIAGPQLRVVPVTIHIPLSEVPSALTADLIRETARITAAGLARDFGIAAPRLAVCGLNPHAGEGGAIGREEIETIAPAIEQLRAEGLAVTGPHPADALFHAAARGRYDAVLGMYHDQVLIPAKTLDFDDGVNVTLGLPFVRTSPDHGTAFDIAGQGIARPDSLMAALAMAAEMAARRGA